MMHAFLHYSSCWEWKWSIHCRRSLSVFAEHRDRCYSGELIFTRPPKTSLDLLPRPSHIWCRNIEWCMGFFTDSSCCEWKWSIHRRDIISKCVCGTPRSTIFRWIFSYSASENFAWFTSPYLVQEYRMMHAFLQWFLVLWIERIDSLQAISKCLRGTTRSTIFRWIAIYSASENFTWLTSPIFGAGI